MYYLGQELWFPDVKKASPEGLLAIGGDLTVERVLLAYKSGIFPWFEAQEPILWWSPDPRFVLFPKKIKVSKSMKQLLRKTKFTVTINKDFERVIKYCAQIKRKDQLDTWITNDMINTYMKLHELGFAKSVEVWEDNELVGGLYGVDLNNGVFSGESMFSMVNNASKVGLIYFLKHSNYKLIDCQVYTEHLERLGAEKIPRSVFLNYLNGK
ncbi:leucyl/phenylalanyl-tRNA--protein transferase [Seonamhaeicola sp. ML3]|uniref:leucyl/phenylalanyl-tRNA--protein transferase n=1 Tax=Seonamhaeicola sp. ML3 TaxID=2937786 RepID=UPI00200EE220|nr:leucyl/phenylalanyl-tRNA--protein transferase [Seonamhaeicola sp. ML3]